MVSLPIKLARKWRVCLEYSLTLKKCQLEYSIGSFCVYAGMKVALAIGPTAITKSQKSCVPNTVSLAWRIGSVIRRDLRKHLNPVASLCSFAGGFKLVGRGRIVRLSTDVSSGFVCGSIKIYMDNVTEGHLSIEYQNENLCLRREDGSMVSTVPDLIVLCNDDGSAVFTEHLRFGLFVNILLMPSHSVFKSEFALGIVGPRAFGLGCDYVEYSSSDT